MKQDIISIINKKGINYFIEDEYTVGIVLTGSEIKSIRRRNVSISDSFCEFNNNNELFISKMYIKEYQNSIIIEIVCLKESYCLIGKNLKNSKNK